MPEGDVLRITAARLHEALSGRRLTRAELRWPGLSEARLTGRTVLDTTAYGKHLFTRLGPVPDPSQTRTPSGPLTLHSHLRMDGTWRIDRPDRRLPASGVEIRAVLGNDHALAVGRWLGMLDLVPTPDERSLIAHLGPDLLADDFLDTGLPEALRRAATTPDRPVGELLLDQTVVAGIGTIYMAEPLFHERIWPWTPTGDVPLDTVLTRARHLMLRSVKASTLRTPADRAHGRDSWVHGRANRPCRHCGTIIRVGPIGRAPTERIAYWCPTCQPAAR